MKTDHNPIRIVSLLSGLAIFLCSSILTGQNIPPVLSGIEEASVSYTENSSPIQITNSLTVSDADNVNLSSATVVISENYQSGQDTLLFTNAYGISGNFSSGTLNLTGISSVANYQSALRSVTYQNRSENPSTANRTVSFTVNDGTDPSNTVTRTISITAVNDPPVATNDAYSGVIEEGTLSIPAAGVLANDTDAEADGLTADQIAGPTHSSSFSLNSNGSFTYVHDGSETTSDAFTYRAYDGALYSNTATVTITITPQNDPPVLSNIETTTLSYNEAAGAVTITGTITVSDPDDVNLESATITISTNYQSDQDVLSFTATDGISGVWSSASGTMTLSGSSSKANYQTALRNVKYENTSVTPNTSSRMITFRVNDGNVNSNNQQRAISINAVNNPPVLVEPVSSTVSYTENADPVQITNSITVSDADNTTLSSASVVITGNYQNGQDLLSFTNDNGITGNWIPATGTMSLMGTSSVANYEAALRNVKYSNISENPSTVNRTVSFTVNDGSNPSNTVTRTVSVTAVNDPPVVSDIPDQTVAEGESFTTITLDNYVTDPDHTDAEMVWTYAGNVQLTVNINNRIATITIPAGEWYGSETITFTATDPPGGYDSDPAMFTVTAAPVLGNIEPVTIIYCRNSGKVPVTNTINVDDEDDLYLQGATIRISSGFRSGQDVLSFTAPPGSGINGSFNSTTGIFTLTGPATLDDYQLALRSIRYENTQTTSPDTGIRTISFTVTDGESTSNTVTRNVNITVPTADISGSATICEHTTATIPVALTGNSPWKFSYRRVGSDTTEVLNVQSSPRNLTLKDEGIYQLVEVTDVNNCTGIVTGSASITVIPAPEVTITGLDPAYNLNTIKVPVYGDPEGGNFSCSNPSALIADDNGTMYFYPIIAGIGTHSIIYSYRASPSSCYGYDTALVRVLVADADIIFPDDRNFYCGNDHQFTITGVNTVNDIGEFTIEGGVGLTDNHDNTATVDPSLLNVDTYTITYQYFDGTFLQVTENLIIGTKPEANFSWETECFQAGQAIDLKDKSVSNEGVITSYKWLFYQGSGYDSLMTKDVSYTFSQPGNYLIELQIETSNGCTDTVENVFGLRPTIQLAGQTYFEDFEDSPVSWRSGPSQQVKVNSWTLGSPVKGFSGASSGDNCWYTYIPTTNAPREQSWLTSPCFDFTDTERPMIKLDIWRLFNATRDGAALQASADSGKTWQNVGELQDGINWFNEYNILGSPGGQTIGWSNIRDAGWMVARHDLDDFRNKTKVQFRIAYGSDGTARNTDGIALDNFWIGERNKVALIEHFTNSSDQESKDANLILNGIVAGNSLNVIDLQYHTSFPGADPFNEDNPYIPGARLFYYGLSTVPYSVLDGGSTGQHRFDYDLRVLDEKTVLIRSLIDSKFWINTISTVVGNALNVNAEISARDDIPTSEISIHLAIVERLITGETGANGETEFHSVVKTLLPDAGGTTFYKPWSKGEYQNVSYSWDMQNVYKLGELRVVAFIQDELTKEVYQASMDTVHVQTGLEDPQSGVTESTGFIIFPDPASTQVYIRFNEPLRQNATLELFNNLGSLIRSEKLGSGEMNVVLPIEEYPDGIYLIRITSENRLLGTDKLTISKP
ncbi:MAG: cadherin-like domain-containing protein [Bacteroidales bacterium]|nr:cadherin-like domain-containing protein [Bacteroidales bacterium]